MHPDTLVFIQRHRRHLLRLLAAAFALVLVNGASSAVAGQLPAPTGETLLVVKGDIGNTNVGAEAHFDRAMLEQLGFQRIFTRTPWHEADTKFEGVPAAKLIEAVDARGTSLLATAANDYHVSIPITDLATQKVLLALRIDDADLTLRTKGPIWVIYPEGSDLPPQVRAERMIWQLVELEVR